MAAEGNVVAVAFLLAMNCDFHLATGGLAAASPLFEARSIKGLKLGILPTELQDRAAAHLKITEQASCWGGLLLMMLFSALLC